MIDDLIKFIRETYGSNEFIPLHAPLFKGNELHYVSDTISSTFVSSVGGYVDRFEDDIATYTGSPRGVAIVNGTAALHLALKVAGVEPNDIVVTQALTFVATCNAIVHCGASPAFVDVDRHTMGLSPNSLEEWLSENASVGEDKVCRMISDGRIVRACMPMHTFGHPVDLERLSEVCGRWCLVLVEDAAESLGSTYKGRHAGTFGAVGVVSFNGNKIITSGGGGVILAGEKLGARAKHLSTTAKKSHAYEFVHDEIGYNYRMPNLNAALGCAQLERLEGFVTAKRKLAQHYSSYFLGTDMQFFEEPADCRSNYWLNAVICEDKNHRDDLLEITNKNEVMTRPIWTLMTKLDMFKSCAKGRLSNSEWLEERVVNIPSSVVPAFCEST